MSIVLGYDESPGSVRALEIAISLAERFAEPLVLVFGVEPPGGRGEEFLAHQRAVAELGRTAVEHAVEQASAAGVRTVVEMIDAKPAEALVEAGDKHDARVIVVGTRGESPLRGAVVGSVSHKLLHLSDRPVLCVPPTAVVKRTRAPFGALDRGVSALQRDGSVAAGRRGRPGCRADRRPQRRSAARS